LFDHIQSVEILFIFQTSCLSCAAPQWKLSFTPAKTPDSVMQQTSKFKVAVVREEGSNGDREMAAAVHAAGEGFGV
jgi:phosphoribosylformylglycinamidine synthase